MRRTATITLALAALLAAPLAAGAEKPVRWLNVHVTENGSTANVEVRLPLPLVRGVLAAVHTDQIDAGKIRLDIEDADVDWPKLLDAIRNAPDGDFVKVTAEDADVTVSKRGGTITVHVSEKKDDHATVDITVPAQLLDALRLDAENRLDLGALLERAAELPDGELVRVKAPDADVRVWIE